MIHKILVIDDEPLIIKVIKITLKNEGYEILSANDGEEGLKLYNEHNPSLVILDLNMPKMTGLQVLERLKLTYMDPTSIIILSGHGTEDEIEQCFKSGVSAFLRKPFNGYELTGMVNNTIKLKDTLSELEKYNKNLEDIVKKRTHELEEKQLQLFQSAKLASLGKITTGIAHEINQPLSVISLVTKSFTKAMNRKLLTEAFIKDGLNDINISIERLSKIINHVRSFGRQQKEEFKQVNVNKTISDAMIFFNEQFRLHEIEIVTEFSQDLPDIMGDAFQLEGVWLNLANNARDNMNEKKKNEKDYKKCFHIITNRHQNFVEVIFKDNGTGMTDEIKDKIFDQFFTTKEEGIGTGLGLSIAKSIIENYSGSIEVETIVGDGTTFRILLPAVSSF